MAYYSEDDLHRIFYRTGGRCHRRNCGQRLVRGNYGERGGSIGQWRVGRL